MKLQVKTAFKSYFFVTKKVIKKQTGSAWKFLQPLIPVCWGAYIPSFKISVPFFCCTLFSENDLNPQVNINKMVNKHIVDYHPILSQLISRIHSHISLDSIFLWSQKIEPVHFRSCSNIKLFPRFLSFPTGRRKLPIPLEQRFLKIYFFPSRKVWEDYGVEKITKIKPTRRVLVTSFDKFHHLCNLNIFGFCFAMP